MGPGIISFPQMILVCSQGWEALMSIPNTFTDKESERSESRKLVEEGTEWDTRLSFSFLEFFNIRILDVICFKTELMNSPMKYKVCMSCYLRLQITWPLCEWFYQEWFISGWISLDSLSNCCVHLVLSEIYYDM